MHLTYEDIRKNDEIKTYIKKADESLSAMGFTEHSFAHVTRVAQIASEILDELDYSDRDQELASIAGYLHDIGNVVNRNDHGHTGAVMAFRILDKLNMDPEETATIITAIGNHDEKSAFPVNSVAAALMIADKSDVRFTRVRNTDIASFDIHDRVNYAVKESKVSVIDKKIIELRLKLDTTVCSVMDYFEIFLGRMVLCRKAAEKLNCQFKLTINGQKVI
ncbi:MAG: HD domain-containing protein [Lachnospiraceae bacterium]|nr:HD domain-containing protein [Lachnospiraceae bacterium]